MDDPSPSAFVDMPDELPAVELHCPQCGYNLSGTTEDRCSECGEAFNRTKLIGWAIGRTEALPFGSLDNSNGFVALFWASLFAPSKLGRLLPPHADPEQVTGYSLGMRCLAGFILPFAFLIIVSMVGGRGGDLFPILVIPLPIFIASVTCEAIIAALLGRFVGARSVPTWDQGRFWRTLCRCFSGYLSVSVMLFVTTIGALLLFAKAMSNPPQVLVWMATFLPHLLLIGTILWWWYGLGSAIAARGEACAARTVIILLIPAIGVAGVIFGFLIGAGEVIVCDR